MLSDQFDAYSVSFSIYHPLHPGESMKINGDVPQLGQWDEGEGPIKMQLSKDEITWVNGEKIKPHKFTTTFYHGEEPLKLKYKYHIANDTEGTKLWERDPTRSLEILDPNDYRGELGIQGSNVWRNAQQCFIVNGHVEIANTNFVSGLNYTKIGETGLIIGPYPEDEKDVKAIKLAGATLVLNT